MASPDEFAVVATCSMKGSRAHHETGELQRFETIEQGRNGDIAQSHHQGARPVEPLMTVKLCLPAGFLMVSHVVVRETDFVAQNESWRTNRFTYEMNWTA